MAKPSKVILSNGSASLAKSSSYLNLADSSLQNFHFLVGTPHGIEYFTEQHHLGLFSSETYLDAFKKCGLKVILDPAGITGRGLYIGTRLMQYLTIY